MQSKKYGIFSEQNINKVWKDEINKGKPILKLFPEINQKSITLSEIRAQKRIEISNFPAGSPQRRSSVRKYRRLRELHQKYLRYRINTKIAEVSIEIQNLVESPDFTWALTFRTYQGKKIFSSDHPEYIFKIIDLCVKNYLNEKYKTKTENKEYIIPQIKNILNTKVPCDVARFDIQSFYEKIDHRKLLKLLDSNFEVDENIKHLVRKMLSEYLVLSGSTMEIGIPRGVALSSALAAIFLENLDSKFRAKFQPDHYFRFVDDFLVIKYCTKTNGDLTKSKIEDFLQSLNLSLNNSKTSINYHMQPNQDSYSFNFIGYKFLINQHASVNSAFNSQTVQIDISDQKYRRYKKRIDKSFEIFIRQQGLGRSQKELFHRILFLTSNSKLNSYKRKKVFGAYFNNHHITNYKNSRLLQLDHYLNSAIQKTEINSSIPVPRNIKNLSFKDGYVKQTFYKTTPKKINSAKRIWKEIA